MIYAEAGNSMQQIGGAMPPGWVIMQGERPTPDHIATSEGLWVIDSQRAADELLANNNTAYTQTTLALTGGYPQIEKDTWPTQEEQARAWANLGPAVALTPWIDRAAAERGIDREVYMRRTLIKSEQFKVMSAFLTGRRQKYKDAIKQGGDPVLDYALTPEVGAMLQQIAADIGGAAVDQIHEFVT